MWQPQQMHYGMQPPHTQRPVHAMQPPSASGPPAAAPQHSAAHLERVKLPTFDGKAENWAEFRRRFKELIKAVNCSPVLEMTFLVDF